MAINGKEMVKLMMPLSFALLIVYNAYYLSYFKRYFPSKRSHWLSYVAAIAISTGITAISYLLLDHRFVVYIIIGSIMLSYHWLFRGSHLQFLYVGTLYMFSLYSSRGIVISVYAIAFNKSIKEILEQDTYYYTTFILAVLLSILSNLLTRRLIVSDLRARQLLYNREQLKFVIIYLFLQLVYLTLVNDGRFLGLKQAWFTDLYCISCVVGKLWLIFIFNHTSKVSELFEYELHTRQLEEQLSRQMHHYQSYRRFTESFRAFQHDYNNMMNSMKNLLQNQEYEQAARMLGNIHDTMHKNVQIHRTYSNNVLLDAILQDAANTCEGKGIFFSAMAHLPESISLTELEIVRIFTNVIDNAIDACDKVSGPDRFIKITSGNTYDWTTIEVSNSFDGHLLMKGSELLSTKENKEFHGLGLKIVKETIEGLGGLVHLDPDSEQGIFQIKLILPTSP